MRLKEIREARGISQRQAAIALNLSPTVYNRYENGLREPSNVVMLAMADYFGVSVDDLLGRDTKKAPADAGDELRGRISRLNPQNREALSAYIDLLLTAQASTAPAPDSPGSKP